MPRHHLRQAVDHAPSIAHGERTVIAAVIGAAVAVSFQESVVLSFNSISFYLNLRSLAAGPSSPD